MKLLIGINILMDDLIKQMQIVLADSFVLYTKAHGYHWNVEGKLFPMLHEFFETIYTEVYNSIDDTAEQIRQIQGRAIHSLEEFDEYKSISDTPVIEGTNTDAMLSDLSIANHLILASLYRAYELSEFNNEFGLCNYLQDRMMAHKKHAWMLRSTLNNTENK
jgi:starvation-inducible DNA-binding protein